ncbi:hypothetical protein FIM02_01060 [SAR202 cluster bacterium AD-802-E10_MRT_200m]|nr:hypothetical protein [SAR202 cluster bacterium AD-802-E10_MRT_200m]
MDKEVNSSNEADVEDQSKPTYYAIDPTWYENRGISLSQLLKLRHLPKCNNQQSGDNAKKRGKSKLLTDDWESGMKALQKCCSKQSGFIAAHMSTMESIFRVLLKVGIKPLSTIQIFEGIEASRSNSDNFNRLTISVLERLLEHQDTYGIRKSEVK